MAYPYTMVDDSYISFGDDDNDQYISMAWCKTAVTPVR